MASYYPYRRILPCLACSGRLMAVTGGPHLPCPPSNRSSPRLGPLCFSASPCLVSSHPEIDRDWAKAAYCSRCESREIDMVISGGMSRDSPQHTGRGPGWKSAALGADGHQRVPRSGRRLGAFRKRIRSGSTVAQVLDRQSTIRYRTLTPLARSLVVGCPAGGPTIRLLAPAPAWRKRPTTAKAVDAALGPVMSQVIEPIRRPLAR
jgi:hypothetical protein